MLLVLPLGLHTVELLLCGGNLLAQGLEALTGGLVVLLLKRLFLDLHLRELTVHRVDVARHAVELHAQATCRFVHQVDGLVGQEAVGDVAVGEVCGRDQCGISDAHAVMLLILLLEATKDGNRVLNGGLGDQHRLETTGQRGVLLDVLAVLVERGGTNGVQLAASEGRLQDVAGVHGALGGTSAHDGVKLVDEQDDAAVGLLDLFEHALETVLKLATVLGAGHERAHVKLDELLVLQR